MQNRVLISGFCHRHFGHQLRTPLPWRCWRNPAAMQNCNVRPRWVPETGNLQLVYPTFNWKRKRRRFFFPSRKTEIAIEEIYDWIGWGNKNPFWVASSHDVLGSVLGEKVHMIENWLGSAVGLLMWICQDPPISVQLNLKVSWSGNQRNEPYS